MYSDMGMGIRVSVACLHLVERRVECAQQIQIQAVLTRLHPQHEDRTGSLDSDPARLHALEVAFLTQSHAMATAAPNTRAPSTATGP